MDTLADLFATNRIVVLSVYGQVFFVMGLAIALQSLKRSTVPLARALPWLAAFGILHGLHEWGYLFVPLQSGYLPLPLTEALLFVQLAIKGISFALLLQFGVELVRSTGRLATLPRWLPAVLLLAWGGATAAVSTSTAAQVPSPDAWLEAGKIDEALNLIGASLAVGDVLGRWMLALPGALLAAWGLWASAAELGSVARPRVMAGLRTAALAFGAYAVVGGLLGMPAPFAPASEVNGSTVGAALGIPIEVLRSFAGLVIAVAVIAALDLFEQETDRTLGEARGRAVLARERERIGRDLHDGVIQSIYAAGLHLDAMTTTLDTEESRVAIHRVMGELDRTIAEIRGYISGLEDEGNDGLDPAATIAAVAAEMDLSSLVVFDLRVQDAWLPPLTVGDAEELRQIVRAAFSNTLRHAHATRIETRLWSVGADLRLLIRDDGAGFDVASSASSGGRGLDNMRGRAKLLGGSLTVETGAGRGTTVSLTMPLPTSGRSA
ncbi:MAG: histidine kinase [Chloroflexota bacterium]|nr:histidine kinase [Chloroflexota bacterium]